LLSPGTQSGKMRGRSWTLLLLLVVVLGSSLVTCERSLRRRARQRTTEEQDDQTERHVAARLRSRTRKLSGVDERAEVRGRQGSRLQHQGRLDGRITSTPHSQSARLRATKPPTRGQKTRRRGVARGGSRGAVRDRIIIRVPKGDKSENEHEDENIDNITTSTTTAATGLQQEQDVPHKIEETTPSPPEPADNTSLPSEQIKEQINDQTGANDKTYNETLEHNKENRKHQPVQENLVSGWTEKTPKPVNALRNFISRRRGGGGRQVTQSPAEETISQRASNLFLSTFMGAQRTEAPILSSTTSKMILVTVTESTIAKKSKKPGIRIKSSKTETNIQKISLHRFQPTPKISKKEEQEGKISIAPQDLTSKGNFIERTKLKFLSRTLFKGEAERKSENLPGVLKPHSEIKTEKKEVKKTKSPLFAQRPRFGFNFGKRNRNLDRNKNLFGSKETDNSKSIDKTEPVRHNLNISKFSRKGLKKTFPRVLSQSAAFEDQGETTEQADEATIEGSTSTEPASSQTATTRATSTSMLTESTTTRATSTAMLTESTTTTAVTSNEIITEIKPVTTTTVIDVVTENANTFTDDAVTVVNDPMPITSTNTETTQQHEMKTSTTTATTTTITTTTLAPSSSSSSSSEEGTKRISPRGRFRVQQRNRIGDRDNGNKMTGDEKTEIVGRNIRVRPRGRGRTNPKDHPKEETGEVVDRRLAVRGRVRGRGRGLSLKKTKEEVRSLPAASGSRRKLVRDQKEESTEDENTEKTVAVTTKAQLRSREITTISNIIDESPVTEAKDTFLTSRTQLKTRGRSNRTKDKQQSDRSKSIRSRSRSRARHPNIVNTEDDLKKATPSVRRLASQRGRGRGRGRSRPSLKTEDEPSTTVATTSTQTTTVTTTKEIPTTVTEAPDTMEAIVAASTAAAATEEEYLFFPAESSESRENYQQQQLTTPVIETLAETDTDLSHHLSSAISLATVTWSQDPYRPEEVSEGSLPTFDIDFSKNTSPQ